MAITINQQPTIPNMANADLLWSVSSNVSTNPQFQYIVDIYESGSAYTAANRLQRVKQQPNPSGYGVFNLGQIISTYVESDNVWKARPFELSTECNKDFVLLFGEEYGTSTSSSIRTYDGTGPGATAGQPAYSGSTEFYTITDGLVDPYDAVNFNFASSSYYTPQTASSDEAFTEQVALTSSPITQSIQDGEYQTISVYNGNVDNGEILAQDIFYYQISWYNSAGLQIQNNDFINKISNGGGPRTNDGDEWTDVYTEQDNGTRLLHVGVGPQNLEDAGISIPATWDHYIVSLRAQGDDLQEDGDTQWAQYRFNKSTGECSYNGVRFAWKNEFGVWDYYTFTLQSDSTFGVTREEFEQTFVNYSTTSTAVSYDKSRRGSRQFYNALNNSKTANSNWLTQAEADWLRELFFSANVYIQVGTDMLPVAITSANVVEKTNPRTQKNFQYTIEFKPANQLRPRE